MPNKIILIALLILTSNIGFSEEMQTSENPAKKEEKTFTEKAVEKTTQAVDYIKEKSAEAKQSIDEKSLKSAQARLDRSFGLYGTYSYLDLLIPGKIGFNIYKSFEDKNIEYEFQYLKGDYSIPLGIADLGKITDKRYTLLKRKFAENGNFNWYYGVSYISFDGQIGSDLMSKLTIAGSSTPNVDLFEIKSLGLDFGIGHRWHFKNNFTFGVDWFSFSQPLIILKKEAPYTEAETTSDNDRNNASNALNTAAYFPRFAFLKLNLGFSF